MKAPYSPCEHLISLSRFSSSIERVITRGINVFGHMPHGRLVPVVIGLDIQCNAPHHDGLILEFLRQLVNHQSGHFVRFIAHRDWAIRAGVVDRYYTDISDLDKSADIIWSVIPTGTSRVGIDISITSTYEQQVYLSTISQELRGETWCQSTSSDHLCYLMRYLPFRAPALPHAADHISQLHVLMIPKREGNKFIYVPVRTMTAHDSRYRYHRLCEEWSYQYHAQYEIFPQQLNTGDHLTGLIDLIRDNDRYGICPHATRDVYALAEMLYAIYMSDDNSAQHTHDVILFHLGSEIKRDLTTYRLPISEMHRKPA